MVEKNKSIINGNKYVYAISLSVILVVGVILLSVFAIKPLFDGAKKVTTDVKNKQEELEKLENKKAKLEQLKDKETELKAQSEKISNALPQTKDVGRLFIQVNDIATGSGGSIKSVTESGAVAPSTTTTTQEPIGAVQKTVYTVPIDFGTYFDWKNFVNKVETALRLVNIGDYSVKASDSGGINSDVTITTYTRN